ncbi:S-adenosyl-L-methionine-dependent methyltransferase [Gymnopus androsaceus JB14]|uniref:S-adenosyl-L-methionine-dependent methyltransferase n=1 Tax=Gymnopus androsaceus JB14 TaxID=1447944 RepID=A0A6A4IJH1_9AGAR|nr:S-adenosyl-L-methionine-dependent methyltransferase [Gymnopus androsaceus JB14]
MGRGRPRKKGGRGEGRGGKKDEYRTDLIEKSDMKNERFFAYYKAQKIVPEDEWESFLEALRTPLPTTFRVAGSRQIAQSLNETIKDVHVPQLSDVTFEDQKLPPPVQLSWYPDGLAGNSTSQKSAQKSRFEGNISRQEAVSMLPPLFLEVEPHHTVMDMCAAPGSKTAQLLEALHAQDTLTSTSIPSGLLVANDSDYKRTHLLIHQSARLPSPAFMVTNLDASNYPSIKLPAGSGSNRKEQLLFDRILCDVPCSGDGTIRKNIGIWKSWQPNDGNGLHGNIVKLDPQTDYNCAILQRAMKMLKPNGRIVYSTCSINPVENEGVIAAALESSPEFQLVDVSSSLPELKRRPGMTSWRPTADKSISTMYETYEAFVSADPQAAASTKLTAGHWPPANVDELNLDRCMRIYPHLQDSGGFFVAVLERKHVEAKPNRERKRTAENMEPSEPETKKPRLGSESDAITPDVPVQSTSGADAKSTTESGGGGGSFKEMPYTFLSPRDPTLLSCISRLRLTSEFPSSNVLVRNPEGDVVRSMYLTNDLIKQIILANDFTKIRLTAAGTKVFTKQEGGKGIEAQYRILGEGLPVVLPYTNPQSIITGDMNILKTLVLSHYPLCTSFEESFRAVLDTLELGCHIVKFPPGELDGASLSHDLLVPIWKSGVSVSLMVDKKAKNAMSLRIFGKEVPPSAREKKPKGAGAEAAPEPEAEVEAEEEAMMDDAEATTPEVVVVQAF